MALDRLLQVRDQGTDREAHFLRQTAGIDRRAALRAWRTAAAHLLTQSFTHWSPDAARRQRQIGQCLAELEVLARQLFDRGWLLKQDLLIETARTAIAPIAAAQAAGKIGDFFPYFRTVIRRYVPVNADQIQQVARRQGSSLAAADVFAGLVGLLRPAQITPTEAIGERHAERVQEACKQPARGRGRPAKFQSAADETLDLFQS
jgi:hypothetical protein